MPSELDIDNWNRREHFAFFSQFDDPSYGVCSEVDCTGAYRLAKNGGYSFFALYLHRSLLAVNAIEEFKYRVVDGRVLIHDRVHASATIGRDDGTFGFSFIPYSEDFREFSTHLHDEVNAVRNTKGLRLNEDTRRMDVVHYSSLPWWGFTGLSHPLSLKSREGIPKITFGKVSEKGSSLRMPVAVHVHHGLVDGLHIAKYLEAFQDLLMR